MFALTNPAAIMARSIENMVLYGSNNPKLAVKVSCDLLSRFVSVTVFPLFLSLELVFKRIPKLLTSIPIYRADPEKATQTFYKHLRKIEKFCLGILFSPLGLRCADAVSTLFLKIPPSNHVRPFGVEQIYGKEVSSICYPKTIEELQQLIRQAKSENKKVSLIGAGMSQGSQTVPTDKNNLVINTKNLNAIEFSGDNQTVKVQAGAIWESIQAEANKRGKSVIVKQASDLFSVGGSIGINCHGWAHEYGAIASTVTSMDIIDASGELKTLTPENELFGCMFGTLGYFGVVVSATLKLANNDHLIAKTTEVEIDSFVKDYQDNIRGKDIPLFGGRLVLDNLEGNPLRKVCMVRYEKDEKAAAAQPIVTSDFQLESKLGTRIERIALQALSHLSYFSARRMIHRFWHSERKVMLQGGKLTRNEALHPPINAFRMLHRSNLHGQWLQEYFIKGENLPNFLRFLGAELKANEVRLINATIRPTPQDKISILPYAEQDRYAVVICFSQLKTEGAIKQTRAWIENVNQFLAQSGDVYYQAYMPYATREQFEQCYGKERVANLRRLKAKYDPGNIFSNGHTQQYFDVK